MRRNWLDVIVDWGLARRLPWWLQLIVIWVGGVVVFNAVDWIEGSAPWWSFTGVSADAAYLPLAIGIYGVTRERAKAGIARFAPALADGVDIADARRDFVRFAPARALIFSAVGAAVGAASVIDNEGAIEQATSSILAYIFVGGFGVLVSYGAFGAAVAYAITLLTRISRLHKEARAANVLRPGPMHAFAPVTASVSAFIAIVVSYSAATDPSTWATPVNRAVAVTMLVVAVVFFVAPLLGARARLREDKTMRLDQSYGRVAAAAAELGSLADAKKYGAVADVKSTVEALRAEHDRIRKASTWPWDPSTVRGVGSALLLPVLTWLITAGVARLLDLS